MTVVKFKNLDSSELAREAVSERLDCLKDKFPDLKACRIVTLLEMHNSPFKPGPDLFTVKVQVLNGRYRGVTISKSDGNLYVAFAAVAENLLERLNRFGDRTRVKNRRQARSAVNTLVGSEVPEMKMDG
jgi:ribosome-associated translation inhibitor RaiA